MLSTKSNINKNLTHTAWMFVERIARVMSGVFVGIWVARYLGPEEFGIYSYAISLIAILSSVAKLGLDSIVVREIVNAGTQKKEIVSTAFRLKFLSGSVLLLILNIFILMGEMEYRTKAFLCVYSFTLLFSSTEVVEFIFQAELKAKVITLTKIIQLTFSSFLKVVLILNDSDLVWFSFSLLADAIFLSLCHLISLRLMNQPSLFKYYRSEIVARLLKDSWPLILTSLSVILYNHTDKIMLTRMVGAHQTGIYSAGTKIPESLTFIAMVFSISLFPAILKSRKVSQMKYLNRLQRFYFLMTWSGICSCISIFIGSKLLIDLYGNEFSHAREIMVCQSFGLIFTFQWIARGRWVVAENLQSISFYYMAIGALLNIILNYYFIQMLGAIGASFASVMTQILITLIFPLFFARFRIQTIMLLKSFYTWRCL